jgi:hypothetical protein
VSTTSVVALTLLDPAVTSPAVVEDASGGGMRLIPSVGDGGTTAEPAFGAEVTPAVGRFKIAPGASSAEKDQNTIPTIMAPAPAVTVSHKMSPASLSRCSPTIEVASVGILHSRALTSVRNTGLLMKFHQ